MIENVKREFIDKIDKYKNNKKLLIKVLLIVLILAAALVLRINENSKSNVSVDTSAKETETVVEMYVDIDGAVKNPGVYEVDSQTRLYEVIEKAGGLKDTADTSTINRAQFVEDGQKISIPSKLDTQDTVTSDTTTASANEQQSNSSGMININTASREELMELSGVGEVIADRIIEYRSKTRFNSIEDIMCVKGIGTATFEKFKSQITV